MAAGGGFDRSVDEGDDLLIFKLSGCLCVLVFVSIRGQCTIDFSFLIKHGNLWWILSAKYAVVST
jgi:hypothetical protein